MTDLLVGLVALLALSGILLCLAPRVRERIRNAISSRERERLEDVLKHLSEAERQGTPVSLHGLAGRLGTSAGKAVEILSRLANMGMVRLGDEGYVLTKEGRAGALQLLRAHRLWERYLADRTNLEPEEWHARAERMEHRLEAEDTEELSLRLGHPRYDPHGDPIPSAGGELPTPSGVALLRLEEGRAGTVTHLEDEPPEVYRALRAAGLAPGVRLEVTRRGPDGVTLQLGAAAVTLDPSEAGNVTVEALPPGARVVPSRRTLADAELGETVTVTGLAPTLQGPQRRRLLDLGLVGGTRVTPELESASGDPVAYRIRGALIALRSSQAEAVEIEDGSAGG